MKDIKVLLLFSLVIIISCGEKINQINDIGQKVGYWKYAPTDGTLEKGYYVKGLKTGKWEYFSKGNLIKSVIFSSNDNLAVEDRSYYLENQHFLTEKVIEGQTVDIDVKIDSFYRKVYLYEKSIRILGSDLFLFNCSSSGCHGGYPFIKDEIDIEKYSNVDTLYTFIKRNNHGNWTDGVYRRIDFADIEAIKEYIIGSERKSIE